MRDVCSTKNVLCGERKVSVCMCYAAPNNKKHFKNLYKYGFMVVSKSIQKMRLVWLGGLSMRQKNCA